MGTRKSKLALAQTELVRQRILEKFPKAQVELVKISTQGDEQLNRSLTSFGGKGVFTRELEEALLQGAIDLAVHSAKDMPMEFPEGLGIGAVLERADVRDVFVTTSGVSLKDLPAGSIVGTSSLRRELQIKELHPLVQICMLRGNVQTRIRRLQEGDYDGILLAAAGLARLGMEESEHLHFEYLDPKTFLPAAGQGILAVEARKGHLREVLFAIHSREAERMLLAERSFLETIGGSCNAPAAAYCRYEGTGLAMDVFYAADGKHGVRRAGFLPLRGEYGQKQATKAQIGLEGTAESGASLEQMVEPGASLEQMVEPEASLEQMAEFGAGLEQVAKFGAGLAQEVKKGTVFLVGAGPGDPGLMSQKGLELLRLADVLVYDNLISSSLLNETKEDAELIYAGKRSSHHHLRQEETNALLVRKALEGKMVVRLKGGDPFIFGRGGEEAQELLAAGVSYEVVPGISSSYAAAAYAGIPVTHRDYASSFHVITGHESNKKEGLALDYATLAREEGTLVFLMGLGNLPGITASLMEQGKAKDTPAAVIQSGTTSRQRCVTGTLETIVDIVREAGIQTPAVTLVGQVVRLRQELQWFGNKPLFGTRVLLTGTRGMCQKQVQVLKETGAEAVPLSLIRTEPLDSPELTEAMENLSGYRWIVLTSSNGVDLFFRYLRERNIDLRSLWGLRFAVIGEGTRKALEGYGILPDFVPEKYSSQDLAREWIPQLSSSEPVLLLRAREASQELPKALEEAGIPWKAVAMYQTGTDLRMGEELNRILPEMDYVTFASGSAVRAFASMVDHRQGLPRVICIGPVTERAAEKAGIPVYATAAEYTAEGMRNVILQGRSVEARS
ncbi:MAG: hydroxymethylbilane synthase [Lachnospiraceae bacterium]|nr:hydroxymethylbilane synthase [Lachnospiraceae bacterium]